MLKFTSSLIATTTVLNDNYISNNNNTDEHIFSLKEIKFIAHVYVMPIILFIGAVGQILNLATLAQPTLRGISFVYLQVCNVVT
jgi:hypothetical protein